MKLGILLEGLLEADEQQPRRRRTFSKEEMNAIVEFFDENIQGRTNKITVKHAEDLDNYLSMQYEGKFPERTIETYVGTLEKIYVGVNGETPINYSLPGGRRINVAGQESGIFVASFEMMRAVNDILNIPYSKFRENAETAKKKYLLKYAKELAKQPADEGAVPAEFKMGKLSAVDFLRRTVNSMKKRGTLTDEQLERLKDHKNDIVAYLMVYGRPKRNIMKLIDKYRGPGMSAPGRIKKKQKGD